MERSKLMYYWIIWLVLAILFSIFWGVHGFQYEKERKEGNAWIIAGAFLSEFIGSFAGWCCFYIFVVRHPQFTYEAFTGADIFLVIGAVIGMAGYSYRIAELVEKYKK
jgi:RsiW-degrading membrane proteinase PrsW (M82 family)